MLARLKIVVVLFFRMSFDKLYCYIKRFCNISNVNEQGAFVIAKLSANFHFGAKIKKLRIGH